MWVWALLLLLAVTSVYMNLGEQVVRPLVSWLSPLTPSPFDLNPRVPQNVPIEPQITRVQALELARAEAMRRGWSTPAGGLLYDPEHGLYGVGFFAPGNDHGDGTLGNPWLYFHGRDGSYAGQEVPGEGSAGDVFLQAQFPLHSGRLFGLTGRIAVSALGLIVATLSLTGMLIWARKRRARARSSRGHGPASVATNTRVSA